MVIWKQYGYEMYCKLLEEAVKEIQGEEVVEEIDTQIDLKITAFIPSDYIENANQKIEVYQDIANLEKEEQISEMIDELIDRYGELPNETVNLIEVARIKILARKLQILSITQKMDSIVIKFNETEHNFIENVQKLIDIYKNKIFFSSGVSPYITLKLQSQKDSDILEDVYKLLTILKG